MNSKRLYFGMLAIIGILAIGLIGGAYFANQFLQKQSDRLVSDERKIAVLSEKQQGLIQAKADIKKYQGLSNIAQSIVPQDKDEAEAVRQITDIASASGIRLGSITFPTSTLGTAAGTSAGSSAKTSLTQLVPVKNIPGVYSLQLVVQSDTNNPVPYNNFINYLKSLEQNRRTALVNSISITPDSKDRSKISFTLTLDEYIKP